MHDQTRLVYEITKDPNAIFSNYDQKEIKAFNIIWRAAAWAQTTEFIKDTDMFVTENRRHLDIIRRTHQAVRENMRIKPSLNEYPTKTSFGDWRDEIIIWWNIMVKVITERQALRARYEKDELSEEEERRFEELLKVPQLYLYGETNCGKTSFIRKLLSILF